MTGSSSRAVSDSRSPGPRNARPRSRTPSASTSSNRASRSSSPTPASIPLLRNNPAIRDLGIIAYAGAPLITPNGQCSAPCARSTTSPGTGPPSRSRSSPTSPGRSSAKFNSTPPSTTTASGQIAPNVPRATTRSAVRRGSCQTRFRVRAVPGGPACFRGRRGICDVGQWGGRRGSRHLEMWPLVDLR